MKRYIAPLAIAFSLFSASAQATVVDTFQQYNFSGVCTDCNLATHAPSLAELVLKNYVAGTAITRYNFVSFHYDGSDKLAAYTIDNNPLNPDIPSMQGFMYASLATQSVLFVAQGNNHFTVSNSGAWTTDLQDEGTGGTFSSAVPEPGTLALLGLGLAGIGGMMRRRQQD